MSERYAVRVALAFTVLSIAAPAIAHPGHDHGHWSSPAVHAVFLLVSLAFIGLGAWLYRSFKKNDKTK